MKIFCHNLSLTIFLLVFIIGVTEVWIHLPWLSAHSQLFCWAGSGYVELAVGVVVTDVVVFVICGVVVIVVVCVAVVVAGVVGSEVVVVVVFVVDAVVVVVWHWEQSGSQINRCWPNYSVLSTSSNTNIQCIWIKYCLKSMIALYSQYYDVMGFTFSGCESHLRDKKNNTLL